MIVTNTDGGGTFEHAPVGSHIARCIKIIDLGTQKGEWQGEANFKHKIIIAWELPNELMSEGEFKGKPFSVSKFYTASLGEKASLRKDLANWRGRDFSEQELLGFDLKNILGKPCMVSVTLSDKGKARVSGVMAAPKGVPVPEQINPSVHFSLQEFDQKVFDSLSDGFKNMIMVSPEYQSLSNGSSESSGFGRESDFLDDIPF